MFGNGPKIPISKKSERELRFTRVVAPILLFSLAIMYGCVTVHVGWTLWGIVCGLAGVLAIMLAVGVINGVSRELKRRKAEKILT